ncbi:MAG: hypothetical protein OEM46_06255 [Ignavibacteria bacterium]|nr:hypothetical protein [Ignavibacteria bacterium]
MKKYIIATVLLLILIITSNIHADEITDKLDSPDWSIRYETVTYIIDNNLVQYTSALADRIFIQPSLGIMHHFLEGLFALQYVNIEQSIFQFINMCDQFPQEQPLYYKVKATGFLVALDNLTTVDYVFEYINIDPIENGERFIPLLKEIAVKMPQHSQTIKELLVNIKDNSDSYLLRREAIEDLIFLFGENNLHNEILASITTDTDANIRKFAMEHYNFADREDLLKQQIQNDAHRYLRIMYVEDILKNYSQPEDLKFVIDYLPFEPDTNASWNIESQIGLFFPPKPENLEYNELISRLISYTDEMFRYGWIENGETRDYYAEGLTEVNESIKKINETIEACSIINKQLLPQTEQDLQEQLITEEGYKFLHYYTIYIKEEIEDEFGHCP